MADRTAHHLDALMAHLSVLHWVRQKADSSADLTARHLVLHWVPQMAERANLMADQMAHHSAVLKGRQMVVGHWARCSAHHWVRLMAERAMLTVDQSAHHSVAQTAHLMVVCSVHCWVLHSVQQMVD